MSRETKAMWALGFIIIRCAYAICWAIRSSNQNLGDTGRNWQTAMDHMHLATEALDENLTAPPQPSEGKQ